MDNIRKSLELLNIFFKKNHIEFWLEAGTALSAFRDGKIFPWEHDIDVAIWRDQMPNPEKFINFFSREGYEVIVQKDFPFIDNIIQLRADKKQEKNLFDIDIYLYSRKDGSAYMRWIQKPEGDYSNIKRRLIFILRNLCNPKTKKWRVYSKMLPKRFSKILFRKYLIFHIKNSTCIYHKFPEEFFLDLKKILFYGLNINIPSNTESYLEHRYGSSWNIPDSEFNESGKWKKSEARVELEMSLLPIPDYYHQIIKSTK